MTEDEQVEDHEIENGLLSGNPILNEQVLIPYRFHDSDPEGFSTEKYLDACKADFETALGKYDRIYVDIGGKICNDQCAARILPGYIPNTKILLLKKLRDELNCQCDVIFCVAANNVKSTKPRRNFRPGHIQDDPIRMIEALDAQGFKPTAVVLTQFTNQPAATRLQEILTKKGLKVVTHAPIRGYPDDVDYALTEEGLGSCEFVPVSGKVVAVLSALSGAGKLSVCASQLWHEFHANPNIRVNFRKFQTFPLRDQNGVINRAHHVNCAELHSRADSMHWEGEKGDIMASQTEQHFERASPVLQALCDRFSQGLSVLDEVNHLLAGIVNEGVCVAAADQEMIRRYYEICVAVDEGRASVKAMRAMALGLVLCELDEFSRPCVKPALEAGAAIELLNGQIYSGASFAEVFVTAATDLAGVDKSKIWPQIEASVAVLNRVTNRSCSGGETTVFDALVVLATLGNPESKAVLSVLPQFRSCQAHGRQIHDRDWEGLHRLGIHATG